MSGSIVYQKDRCRWAVYWWCQLDHKRICVTRYTPTWDFLTSEQLAQKQLSIIQRDWEMHLRGEYQFRPHKYTKRGSTDVVNFFEKWMDEKVKPRRTPATIKGYQSYFKNWIEPFFTKNRAALHEIQYDTIIKFMNFIKGSPKLKLNIVMCLHEMLDYSRLAGWISVMPPFPKREDYNLIEPTIEWISADVQQAILDVMPECHRPIFQFLMLHFRRVGEACALYKTDYDVIHQAFTINRAISARTLIQQTKTKKIHVIPCSEEFIPTVVKLLNQNLESPFLFVNPLARKQGKRYSHESLNIIWEHACKNVGVSVPLYHGVKHSSCTNYIEGGGTIDELQIMTDHARRESVLKYAEITLRRKKEMFQKRTRQQNCIKPNLTIVKY
jgi:hypothetical protein